MEQIDSFDFKRLTEIYWELDAFWKRMHGYYLDSLAGFSFVRQRIESDQAKVRKWIADAEISSEEFQDKRLFSYAGIFSNEVCASGIHTATHGEVKKRNSPGGTNFNTLGQSCIVMLFSHWDEYFRGEWAAAKGIKKEEILDDFWGDMRHLRRSIIHHKSIALPEVKDCKIIKWFQEGDEITLTPLMMREIFLAVLRTRNKIHSDSLPKSTFTLSDYRPPDIEKE